MKFLIAIPARYASTRFPGKVLADLAGKPVLRRVWEKARTIPGIADVVVLTESEIVQKAVQSWGGTCVMTPDTCKSGTERIASALSHFDGDFIFNIQADEPFLEVELIERMMASAKENPKFDVLTPIFPLTDVEDVFDPNVVKVVCQHDGTALYFSRNPIPYLRDVEKEQWAARGHYFGHMGIYLYRRSLLEKLNDIPASHLATSESLEQLRFLQAGYCIRTLQANGKSISIDTLADLEKARVAVAE